VTTVWKDGRDQVPTSMVSEDDHLSSLYLLHYRSLVRLAALLLDETAAAEDVVQEAFVKLAAGGRLARLRDPDAALGYIRTTVLNLARSSLRRRRVATRYAPLVHGRDRVEDGTVAAVDRAVIVMAMRNLPRRQREAIALRYYSDLTEAQTADLMGVSTGAVKAYTSRGLDRLAQQLEASR
jgi:RNA polymerase sigma-70 factor (sigma-E family)